MFSGKPVPCDHDCEYCPPNDFYRIAHNTGYFECLNYPDSMFGTGAASEGLGDVASAISDLANAVNDHE